jgi:GntR family transcriptional regulator, transcriptional repressor for pyruvate dehydrogenase complex
LPFFDRLSDKALDNRFMETGLNGSMSVDSLAYAELAEVLRRKVVSGEIPEGKRLPTELALASEMGISRSTVREAFRVLQAWGFLRRISPRVLVAAKPISSAAQRETRIALLEQKATHDDVYQTMYALVPALVALAAQRATDADVEALRSIVTAQSKCFTDIRASNRLVGQFHAEIGVISRNPAMVIARASLRNLLMPNTNDPDQVLRLTHWAFDGHNKIITAIAEHDPEIAALVTRRHIEKFRSHWEAAGLDFNSEISSFGFGSE